MYEGMKGNPALLFAIVCLWYLGRMKMKKSGLNLILLGALGIVLCGNVSHAQHHASSVPTKEEGSIEGDAQDVPGAPVAFAKRPEFDAAGYGLDTMLVQRMNVFQMNGNQQAPQGPGAAAAVSQQQAGMPMNSLLRYEHTEFDGVDADSDKIGLTLRTQWVWDKVSIDAALPIDRVEFDDEYDDFDFTRVGLVITPRLQLLSQDEQYVDLYFGLNMFYSHTFFDDDDAYQDLIYGTQRAAGTTENTTEEDSDHVGIGPMLTVMKDYEKFSLGMGAIWQRGRNIGGDEEFYDDNGNNRKEDLDVLMIGGNVGVPVGDRWFLTGLTTYKHIYDNYEDLDSDWFTVGMGATYMLNDKWTLDAMVDTDIGADDLDSRWQFSMGAVWRF